MEKRCEVCNVIVHPKKMFEKFGLVYCSLEHLDADEDRRSRLFNKHHWYVDKRREKEKKDDLYGLRSRLDFGSGGSAY